MYTWLQDKFTNPVHPCVFNHLCSWVSMDERINISCNTYTSPKHTHTHIPKIMFQYLMCWALPSATKHSLAPAGVDYCVGAQLICPILYVFQGTTSFLSSSPTQEPKLKGLFESWMSDVTTAGAMILTESQSSRVTTAGAMVLIESRSCDLSWELKSSN